MKIKILSERENPLLDRREIKFRVRYEEATPPIKAVRSKLIAFLSSDEKLTIMNQIKPEFGKTSALGYAKVYKDEKAMEIEPAHRIKKNFEKLGSEKGESEDKSISGGEK